MLFAKIALGLAGTIAVAGAYTFHEGVFCVDVDEDRPNGSHVHFWLPAAVIPNAMRLVPKEQLERGARQAAPWVPLVRSVTKELAKYPDIDLVEVRDVTQHVQIRTHNGKLQIDVDAPGEQVHVRCPLSTLDEVFSQLETFSPRA